MKFTPEKIIALEPNQIFVFGSNLAGNHAGGAAKTAADRWGAKEGVGEGPTGQCYAFPTLNEDFTKRTTEDLLRSRLRLYECAEKNPEKTFLVTKLGLGIAGYPLEEMRFVFTGIKPDNIILPIEFS